MIAPGQNTVVNKKICKIQPAMCQVCEPRLRSNLCCMTSCKRVSTESKIEGILLSCLYPLRQVPRRPVGLDAISARILRAHLCSSSSLVNSPHSSSILSMLYSANILYVSKLAAKYSWVFSNFSLLRSSLDRIFLFVR
jgi:hypothetical protein